MIEPVEDAVVVFTARSPDRIVEEGGSQAWALNALRARRCTYLVCTQNRHNPDLDFSDASEEHGSAFLIGRISGVRRSEEDEGRWRIVIDAYARVALPAVWQHWRNPVRYTSLDALGIDARTLDFQPMPARPPAADLQRAPAAAIDEGNLTIAEAKRRLAATFGVKPEAIEIVVRG